MQEKEAVVLGAGVIGLSTAIELLRRGWEVTVAAKAPPIAQQGDTVVFNAESYATAGDLKAKKIGSQFRITRAALDDFLKS